MYTLVRTCIISFLFSACISNAVAQYQPRSSYDEETKTMIYNGEMPARYVNIKYDTFSFTIDDYAVEESTINYGTKTSLYGNSGTVRPHIVADYTYYLEPTTENVILHQSQCEDINERQIVLQTTTNIQNPQEIHFRVSAHLLESIKELPSSLGNINLLKWFDTHILWQGTTPAIALKDSANCFRVPLISSFDNRDNLSKQLNLKDTTVILQGMDYSYIGDVVYKGKTGIFSIDDIVFKVEMYRKEALVETKYIRISFSYGC